MDDKLTEVGAPLPPLVTVIESTKFHTKESFSKPTCVPFL